MGNLKLNRSAIAGIAVYAVLFLLLCLYAAFGLVSSEGVWLPVAVVFAFAAMIFVIVKRETIAAALEPHPLLVKPTICVVLVLASFFLLERPYNLAILGISSYHIFVNLCLVGALFCIVFFAGQQSRAAAIGFLVICFGIGLANYFVISFKGQPVLPSDLFALETAAAVGGGYTYAIDANVVVSYLVLAASGLVASFLPAATMKAKRVVANACLSLLFVFGFGWWFTGNDIEAAYGCEVDVWGARESYAQNGSLLCFLKRVQDLTPTTPGDYSPEMVDSMLASYKSADGNALLDADERPSVVVIMNETFADLSTYPALDGVYDGPAYYHSIDDAAAKGSAYVSALGGGTCNSEFEFLTGSSMGSLGGGVYPYVLYDLAGTENLAAYFGALGYDTWAMHPADAANWRRSSVYSQLGFDSFVDIGSFENAETLRGLPTDKETYTKILDALEAADNPQFVFDVTIQNHGGYDTGEIPAGMQVDVPIDGVSYPDLNEYLGCIQRSDQDLEYLIEGLKDLDRPVILCFFGDHQPGFADWMAELSYGEAVSDFDLEAVQSRYEVPYMIWKNYSDEKAADAPVDAGADQLDTSLNYLGSMLVREAGLPLTDYQRFLLATQQGMPAINLNGYLDASGSWHWIGEQSAASDEYHAYELAQFDNLFNKSAENRFTAFAAAYESLRLRDGDFVETPA